MKTQEKVGHLRGVSTNATKKTGREPGYEGPQTGKTERKVVPAGGKKGNPDLIPDGVVR